MHHPGRRTTAPTRRNQSARTRALSVELGQDDVSSINSRETPHGGGGAVQRILRWTPWHVPCSSHVRANTPNRSSWPRAPLAQAWSPRACCRAGRSRSACRSSPSGNGHMAGRARPANNGSGRLLPDPHSASATSPSLLGQQVPQSLALVAQRPAVMSQSK